MEELIKTLEEYISLLESSCGGLSKEIFIQGLQCNKEDVEKGVELRKKILKLKKELKVK